MTTPYFDNGRQTIYHGDFREILNARELERKSGYVWTWQFEAIITDPPYEKKYRDLWKPLAALTYPYLRPGGSFLSIVPHYLLPEVLETFSRYLKYRWIISMDQAQGAHPRMAMGIEVGWKPVVWWVKGSWPTRRGFNIDRFTNTPPKKKLHKWEQSMDWANAMLKFVPAGQPILDPMCGTGTLLVAAAEHGYPAVGVDSDEQACEIAANRLMHAVEQDVA